MIIKDYTWSGFGGAGRTFWDLSCSKLKLNPITEWWILSRFHYFWWKAIAHKSLLWLFYGFKVLTSFPKFHLSIESVTKLLHESIKVCVFQMLISYKGLSSKKILQSTHRWPPGWWFPGRSSSWRPWVFLPSGGTPCTWPSRWWCRPCGWCRTRRTSEPRRCCRRHRPCPGKGEKNWDSPS